MKKYWNFSYSSISNVFLLQVCCVFYLRTVQICDGNNNLGQTIDSQGLMYSARTGGEYTHNTTLVFVILLTDVHWYTMIWVKRLRSVQGYPFHPFLLVFFTKTNTVLVSEKQLISILGKKFRISSFTRFLYTRKNSQKR